MANEDRTIPEPSAELGRQLFLAGVTKVNAEKFRDSSARYRNFEAADYFQAEYDSLVLFSDGEPGSSQCPRFGSDNVHGKWTMHTYKTHPSVIGEMLRCIECGYIEMSE